jgi:hypothetical protein
MNAGGSAANRRAEIESMNPDSPDDENAIRAEMQHWIDKGRDRPQPVPVRQIGGMRRGRCAYVVSRGDATWTAYPGGPRQRTRAARRDRPCQQVDTTLLVHPSLLPDFLDFNDLRRSGRKPR